MSRSAPRESRGQIGHGSEKLCVSCGKPIESSQRHGRDGLANHHCSRRHEAAIEAAYRFEREPPVHQPSFGERLADGFALLGGNFKLLPNDEEL